MDIVIFLVLVIGSFLGFLYAYKPSWFSMTGMKNKIKIFFLLICVLAIGAIGFFVYQSTSPENDFDWDILGTWHDTRFQTPHMSAWFAGGQEVSLTFDIIELDESYARIRGVIIGEEPPTYAHHYPPFVIDFDQYFEANVTMSSNRVSAVELGGEIREVPTLTLTSPVIESSRGSHSITIRVNPYQLFVVIEPLTSDTRPHWTLRMFPQRD